MCPSSSAHPFPFTSSHPQDAIITSKHGVITGASLTSVDEDLDLASIQEALVGLKLGTTEVRELGIRFGLGEAEGEVFRWLRREI